MIDYILFWLSAYSAKVLFFVLGLAVALAVLALTEKRKKSQ